MLGDAEARELITRAYCGRIATIGVEGWPYVVPLLHIFAGDEITVHNAAVRGHFRLNVERDARVCFEVDEPVKVFDYGRFECDTGLAYRSAIAYGRIRIVDDRAAKNSFFDALLAKYGTGTPGRPKSFYPRLDDGLCDRGGAHDRQALSAAAALGAVAGARSHEVAERAALAASPSASGDTVPRSSAHATVRPCPTRFAI